MPACIRHPQEPAHWYCQKHRLHLCHACRRCRHPELYCRHRSACTIHFLEKSSRPLEVAPADQAPGA